MLLAEPEANHPNAGMMLQECVPCQCQWSVGYIYLQAGDPRLDDPHTFCICCDSDGGTVEHDWMVQQVMAWFVSPSGMFENVDGRMEFWSSSFDSVEAKKWKVTA